MAGMLTSWHRHTHRSTSAGGTPVTTLPEPKLRVAAPAEPLVLAWLAVLSPGFLSWRLCLAKVDNAGMADVPGVAAETAEVEISLLGGFAVRVNARPVVEGWRLRKAKTLVKLLALAEGHRLHREVLAEWLWPGLDAAAAANNLHQALHVARRVLGMSAPGCRLLELRDDLVVLCPAGHL